MEDYYTIQTPGHHSSLFTELHTLQKQGVLCDVILAAEDGEVMAHKVVLMSASKYFRDKLSPTISANPSRICLKGISVVELANLVKYIYTGKLLVAKETMDVTLEVSEILELKGITQGYDDIVAYEQMKSDGSAVPSISNTDSGQQDDRQRDNMTPSVEASNHDNNSPGQTKSIVSSWSSVNSAQDSTTTVSSSTDETVETSSSIQLNTASLPQVIEGRSETTTDGKVVAQLEQVATTSTQPSTEYSFEFNPYDQQYMDVSVGANTQVSTASNIQRPIKTTNPSQIVTDEQARHQDLLAVAIETLSDPSHFVSGIHKPVYDNETVKEAVVSPGQVVVSDADAISDAEFQQNGKIESKIVTLSAGTVTNELGGQTSVYTVALDPSSIKAPLLMPRVLRKKSEKEKQAEMIAKMYRKKKAELLHRQNIVTPVQTDAVDSSVKNKRTPRILLRSSKSKEGESLLQDTVQHILIHRLQDGSVTTTKVIDNQNMTAQPTDHIVVPTATHEKEEFGQVVNFDSDCDEEGEIATDIGRICTAEIESETAKAVTTIVTEGQKSEETDQYCVNVNKDVSSVKLENIKTVKSSVGSTVNIETESRSFRHRDKDHAETSPKSTDNITKTNEVPQESLDESTAEKVSEKGNDPSITSDTIEAHISDKVRSSATKRKGKEPRRLDHESVSGRKKNLLIPIVRTRRSSRHDNSQSTRTSTSVSRNDKMVDVDKANDCDQSDKSAEENNTAPVRARILESNVGKGKGSNKSSTADTDGKKQKARLKKRFTEAAENKEDTDDDYTDDLASSHSDDDIEYITLDMSVEESGSEKKLRKRKADTKQAQSLVKRSRTISRSSDRSGSVGSVDEAQLPSDLNYFCRYCQFRGGTLSCIEKHLTSVHGNEDRSKSLEGINKVIMESDSKSMVVCDCAICTLIQKPKTASTPPVSCKECDIEYSAEYDLHVHMVKTHGDKQPKTASSYSCPVCGLVESAYSVIDQHIQTHDGVHVVCITCDKKFKTYTEMKKHQVSHSEKRFRCTYCDFSANVAATVQMHIKLKHSKVKEVVTCQFCMYETPLAGNMRKHMLTVHGLHIVTKQSLQNRHKYKGFVEGQLVTKDLRLFDPKTMTVPTSSRCRSNIKCRETTLGQEEGSEKEMVGKRGRKPALHKLPAEEFEKEILKRHQEFLKKPEKNIHFMSHVLATATGHPSFPQASPNVRQTKADKVYHSGKPEYRFQELSEAESQQIFVTDGGNTLPTVGKEIEVIHNDSPVTVVTENVAGDDLGTVYHTDVTGTEQQLIVVTNDGKETLMQSKDFYEALVEKESSVQTKETIGVINALLAAGQQVQIEEKDLNTIEIQNA